MDLAELSALDSFSYLPKNPNRPEIIKITSDQEYYVKLDILSVDNALLRFEDAREGGKSIRVPTGIEVYYYIDKETYRATPRQVEGHHGFVVSQVRTYFVCYNKREVMRLTNPHQQVLFGLPDLNNRLA